VTLLRFEHKKTAGAAGSVLSFTAGVNPESERRFRANVLHQCQQTTLGRVNVVQSVVLFAVGRTVAGYRWCAMAKWHTQGTVQNKRAVCSLVFRRWETGWSGVFETTLHGRFQKNTGEGDFEKSPCEWQLPARSGPPWRVA
jgi:hypothetical protein